MFSWVKLARRSLHIRSLWKLRYPEYFRVKCYNGIFRALADYSVNVKKYQQTPLSTSSRTSSSTLSLTSTTPRGSSTRCRMLFMHHPARCRWMVRRRPRRSRVSQRWTSRSRRHSPRWSGHTLPQRARRRSTCRPRRCFLTFVDSS